MSALNSIVYFRIGLIGIQLENQAALDEIQRGQDSPLRETFEKLARLNSYGASLAITQQGEIIQSDVQRPEPTPLPPPPTTYPTFTIEEIVPLRRGKTIAVACVGGETPNGSVFAYVAIPCTAFLDLVEALPKRDLTSVNMQIIADNISVRTLGVKSQMYEEYYFGEHQINLRVITDPS